MYLRINCGCICTNTLSVHNQIVYINCVQQQFSKILPCPNVEPDLWSGSALLPNLGPNLGPVLKSSGSNFGSEPNCGIPTSRERAAASFRYFGTPTHHTIKISWNLVLSALSIIIDSTWYPDSEISTWTKEKGRFCACTKVVRIKCPYKTEIINRN